MLINGHTLKEIVNLFLTNDYNFIYTNKIIKDYFEENTSWNKFEIICNYEKMKKFFSFFPLPYNFLPHQTLRFYEQCLRSSFPEVFGVSVLPLTLQFNICFCLIENGSDKQLEFNFG